MTEQQPEQDSGGDGEASRITSIESLASRVDRLTSLVERILPGGDRKDPAAAGQPEPESVEEKVRAELAKAEAARRKSERDKADKAEKESVAARLAKLEEKPPAERVRRSTRLLGWGGK